MFLISDLIEGVREILLKRAASILAGGSTLISLLALSDEGAPMFDHQTAADLAAMGSPAFAWTPDKFTDLVAAAIMKRNITAWAASNDTATARSEGKRS